MLVGAVVRSCGVHRREEEGGHGKGTKREVNEK